MAIPAWVYHSFLEDKGIQPSMSGKGNSTDNGMMESFFGILKSEMFYGYEKTFKSIKELEGQSSIILIITTTNESK